MDTVLQAIEQRQNVIVTNLGGVKRSRFLLQTSLNWLSKEALSKPSKKIFHVVSSDANVSTVYNEAKALPFDKLNLGVAKVYGADTAENISSCEEILSQASLVVCTIKYVLDKEAAEKILFTGSLNDTHAFLVIFDGVPLDSIEGTCCELEPGSNDPSVVFTQMTQKCWSTIIACNRPFEGVQVELGCAFPIVIDQPIGAQSYRVFASIITEGPSGVPMSFTGDAKPYDEVGRIVEECAKRIESGGIVVFLPSYVKMLEYHSQWKNSGLSERVGLEYARENRGEGQFKQMLINLSKRKDRSIVLISHRYHQDIQLAECVLSSSTRVIISVGLPYPFANDTWDARKSHNDEVCLREPGRLSGQQLVMYRAIEFMNGVARKCLDQFRHQDCAFFILDKDVAHERNKFSQELGDVQVETLQQSMKRFDKFCHPT